jgi:nucleotide-binding universal stress UspA family protein
MNAQTSQVVVAFDFTQSSREALNRALTLAARAPFHVLHIACVIDPHAGVPAVPLAGKVDFAYAERVQETIAEVVGQELREAKTNDRVHFFVHARIGKAAEEILMVAREVGADLIILGTKGLTGVERFVLGSVAEKVVREAGCAVEVARPKTYDYVQLLDIREVAAHPHYVKPHRYSYESTCVQMRPHDWPLY